MPRGKIAAMAKEVPPVYCAHHSMVATDSLKPNPRNPNHHGERQIALLARIIKEQGWRQPITVSKRSGFIVRGHCRLEAAKLLGLSKVPVDMQEYKSKEAEEADMVADNKIAEFGETDTEILKAIIDDMDVSMRGLTGYDDRELQKLVGLEIPEAPDLVQIAAASVETPAKGKKGKTQEVEVKAATKERIECPKCHHRFRL